MNPATALRYRALALLRARSRHVVWTYPGVNFGNFLYLWQAVHRARATAPATGRGTARRGDVVLVHGAVMPWLSVFPDLAELSVTRENVRWLDHRELGHDYSEFGVDFTPADLEDFCRSRLLTAPWWTDAGSGSRELVVNVRRGDYYSNPSFRRLYGFDQRAFVARAVRASVAAEGAPESIRVVSDGLDWCRANLDWLNDIAPVHHGSVDDGPAGDFQSVARARRLVITNSSFSYWAAYLSNVIHGDNHASVWAPRFHRRDINGGNAWQLDDRWSILDAPEEGWGSPDDGDLP